MNFLTSIIIRKHVLDSCVRTISVLTVTNGFVMALTIVVITAMKNTVYRRVSSATRASFANRETNVFRWIKSAITKQIVLITVTKVDLVKNLMLALQRIAVVVLFYQQAQHASAIKAMPSTMSHQNAR
jgi:hypothetical protein